MENLSIKMWAEDDRPREKLKLKGRSILSDSELMAILIGSGTREKSAVELAQEILSNYNNSLSDLGRISISEFEKFKGIGEAKAIKIIAAIELGRRRKEEPTPKPKSIRSSKCAYEILRPYFEDLQHEEFHVIALSRANKVLGTRVISKGGISGTVADGKIIFNYLLEIKASSCILAHNHPSGTLKPSEQDIRLTKKLVEFGKLIELSVLDHLIFTNESYYSFMDEGMM